MRKTHNTFISFDKTIYTLWNKNILRVIQGHEQITIRSSSFEEFILKRPNLRQIRVDSDEGDNFTFQIQERKCISYTKDLMTILPVQGGPYFSEDEYFYVENLWREFTGSYTFQNRSQDHNDQGVKEPISLYPT